MMKSLVAGVTALFVIGLMSISAHGQAKGEKPEKVEIVDPAKARGNNDFAIQGEYEGEVSVQGNTLKVGAQVVALGNGKFDIRFLIGGLPGKGWDGEKEVKAKATWDEGRAVYSGNDPDGVPFSGEISGGQLTGSSQALDRDVVLKKVVRKSPTLGKKPPQGAIVLFDGSDTSEWVNGKLVELSDGTFLGVGTKSKKKFKSFKLHMEFRLAFMPQARGQARSNSGVYLQDRYECQLLDSFGLKGLDNECGGFYKQYAPSVNMCLPPLQWQTYDIEFHAAKFDQDGQKTDNARATVRHNAVTIHDNVELKDSTPGGQPEADTPGPIQLQNHGDPLVFRNIWVEELK